MNSDITNNENVNLWAIGKCIFCKEKIEEDSKILKCLHIICKDCTKRENTDSGKINLMFYLFIYFLFHSILSSFKIHKILKCYENLGIWCKCKIVTKDELIDYSIIAPNQSQVKICCEKNCQLIAKKICMHCNNMYCKPCSKVTLNFFWTLYIYFFSSEYIMFFY